VCSSDLGIRHRLLGMQSELLQGGIEIGCGDRGSAP